MAPPFFWVRLLFALLELIELFFQGSSLFTHGLLDEVCEVAFGDIWFRLDGHCGLFGHFFLGLIVDGSKLIANLRVFRCLFSFTHGDNEDGCKQLFGAVEKVLRECRLVGIGSRKV